MDVETAVEMFFFPYVGGGHQIPMIDMARLFASHGANSTVITTATAAISFQNSIHRDQQQFNRRITIHSLTLPNDAVEPNSDMSATPFTDTTILQEPLKLLLIQRKPDCIVVDNFHRWAAELIDGIGIPRIIFNGNGCFSRCVSDLIHRYAPHEKVGSDFEPFVIPDLPHKIELSRSQLPIFVRKSSNNLRDRKIKSEEKSFGVLINSFYELEPDYAEILKREWGRKSWIVGPVCLCNRKIEDKTERGKPAAIDEQSCLNWLDSKSCNSVLYISFGSLIRLIPEQLLEIAYGLENSNCEFIWVVGKINRDVGSDAGDEENWVPSGFVERMKESKRGLIIRGWAPQMLILEHPAVGGFMTHCGWNSTLEAVSASVAMITWPVTAEQFYNEKLITDVLRIGVKVGSEVWTSFNVEVGTVVGREKVTAAVERLMGDGGGDEVVEMRSRVRELGETAKRAVEDGGSSFVDAQNLIQELKSRRRRQGQNSLFIV